MKRIFTLAAIFAMAFLNVLAQAGTFDGRIVPANKTAVQGLTLAQGVHKAAVVPIVSEDVIDEAPAGTVVDNCIRSCFSYYYSGGSLQGGYNASFAGEYVIGDDGNIYLKNVCASVPLGTYLKLEKVDDETYVAHTAQLIYVDNSGDTPYLAFATRLVYHAYSETSFGYIVEEDSEGKAVTDIYFSFKDGVLQQKDQETIDMNGQILPHELIGFTNSSGGWIGYGDACITIRPVDDVALTLPEGANVRQMSFTYNSMSSTVGENVRNSKLVNVAEVGNDFYLQSPLDNANWIKGTIDRTANTVTFSKQYAGMYEDISCHEWFIPATYQTRKEVWDEEEDYVEWIREYTATDAYVCKYDNGNLVSDASTSQTMVFSRSKTSIEASGIYSDFAVRTYDDNLVTPSTPRILKFEPVELTMFWGELVFAVPPVDLDDVYINKDELSYVVYFNSETTPFTFKTADHMSLSKDMSEFPFAFTDDMDFFNVGGGAFHNLYFYEEGVTYAGVQAIHRKNGQEKRSQIGWYNHAADGISDIHAATSAANGKWLENGRVVIIKNGRKYNVQGQTIE